MIERTRVPDWFSDFVDAIEADEAAYHHCENCRARELPPRDICPECGSPTLVTRSLPTHGTVLTYTEVTTTINKFDGETPYTVVMVELAEELRLTGQFRGEQGVDIGDEVRIGVERRDEREDIVIFEPA